MPTLKNAKVIGAPFDNERARAKVTYDFGKDGGATGTYVAFTVQSDIIVHSVMLAVKTTVTSSSTAACSAGLVSNDDLFIDSIAKASLTQNALIFPVLTEGTPNTSIVPARVASGDNIVFAIETTALLTGVIDIIVEYSKF